MTARSGDSRRAPALGERADAIVLMQLLHLTFGFEADRARVTDVG